MVSGGARLGGAVGVTMVCGDGWWEGKGSKLLVALKGSVLRRESGFYLSIVVFLVCVCFWRRRVKRALPILSHPRFFLLCYFYHHPSGLFLANFLGHLVVTLLGFIELGGGGFNGYLLVITI